MNLFEGVNDEWHDPVEDPPQNCALVEIRTQKNAPMRSVYFNGRFYIVAEGNTIISYANPTGWRLISK